LYAQDLRATGVYLVIALLLWEFLGGFRRSFILFSIISLPGTFLHELLHWLIGSILGARPSKLSIFPRRIGDQYQLGYVEFENIRWYNGFFVGFAPLLLFPAAGLLAVWRTHNISVEPIEFLWLYLCASILGASLPSVQDIKVAFESSWVVFVILLFGLAHHFSILGMK
jgi:hypothetical protein